MLSGKKPHSKPLARAAFTAAGFVLAVFVCLGLSHGVHAQVTANEVLPTALGNVIGTGTADIRVTIARLIRVAFGFLGTVALLLVLYAGFLWMTAAGDEEKVSRAKKTLTSAIIGLIIILAAFGITTYIINVLVNQDQGGSAGTVDSGAVSDSACIGLSATCPAGALGNGIIESHYPPRNATGVPRNTRIAITFKQKIDPASLVVGGATSTVAILKSTSVAGTANDFLGKFVQSLTAADIDVAPAGDGKTFVFVQKNCPTDCFGSPSENVFYTVALRGGSDGIKKSDGTAAFTGTFSSGYLWEFQVSTVLDTTPPRVSYVVPADKETGVARNSIVQVNFDEAVDPVSLNAGFSMTRGAGTVIQGTQMIGNAYRTMEFRTNDACGTNSCGETVYCLPGNQNVKAKVKADAMVGAPPRAQYPPSGVTDMAGNSLDGNADGTAQGGPADDYSFSFDTNDTVDLTPPTIVSENPSFLQGNIPRDVAINATFSKLMSATSITTDSMRLIPPSDGAPTNFSVTSDGVASAAGSQPDQTKASFQHDLLSVNSPPYAADMTSGMRDLHQNCFYPGGAAGGGGGSSCADKTKPYCCNGVPSLTACGFVPSP